MKRRALALVAAGLVLAACSAPPSSGIVTERKYHPAYYYWTSQCVSYDAKTGACTTSIPIQHYMPESFELCLRADDGKTGCRDVDHDEYERYEVGGHYPDPR